MSTRRWAARWRPTTPEGGDSLALSHGALSNAFGPLLGASHGEACSAPEQRGWRQDVERFRGSVQSSDWTRGAFWHHLDVDESVLVVWTVLEGETRIDRATVDRIEFEGIRLPPLVWKTNLRVRLARGQPWPARFVPFRPRQLRRALERLGWPVVDAETVRYRVAVRRALGVER